MQRTHDTQRTTQNYLFAGREYDSESGLYYFRYRYYDPGLGRFINPEPQPDVFLVNLYDYVFNNPVNRLDPLGLTGGGGRGGREPPPPDPQPGVGVVESGVYAATIPPPVIHLIERILVTLFETARWVIQHWEEIQFVKDTAEWVYERYQEFRSRQESRSEERRK